MKEKKTKRKLTGVSKKRGHSTPQDDTENPQTGALPPDASPALPQPYPHHHGPPNSQLPKVKACSRADGQRASGSGRNKSKKQQVKHSTAPSAAGTGSKADRKKKKSTGGSSPQGGKAELLLSPQSRETIRWEGVLEDPLAEEKRLELYRANRRQRYLAHRQAMMMAEAHETATRQDIPKKDNMAVSNLNQ